MNLLVIRFSAMGDVALMTPALVAIAAAYPNVQITVVTRGNFAPFFYNIPNVNVLGINLKKYKGVFGIFHLFHELNTLGPYHSIIDLHASLRSRLISLFFRFKGVKVYKIIKGRREKLQQIRRFRKKLFLLPTTVERYLNVFRKAGFTASFRKGPWINVEGIAKVYAKEYFSANSLPKKEGLWIGFAPFAGHKLKEWPLHKSEKLIPMILAEFPDAKIFLFGSKEEAPILQTLRREELRVFIVTGGKLGIRGELGIMDRLDIMIGMDSSNVHIAALLKKPVIGIYGTTHPYSGFGPFAQEDTGVLQVDLPCRPCLFYLW
jgi:ADP-heptose:LPS heptosyltransferase